MEYDTARRAAMTVQYSDTLVKRMRSLAIRWPNSIEAALRRTFSKKRGAPWLGVQDVMEELEGCLTLFLIAERGEGAYDPAVQH